MSSESERKYWSELCIYMQQEGIQLQAQRPGTASFQVFEIGQCAFCLEAWFYYKRCQEIGVRLRMSP